MDSRQDLDCWHAFDGCARVVLRPDGEVLHWCDLARTLPQAGLGFSLQAKKLRFRNALVDEAFLRKHIGADGFGLLDRDTGRALLASYRTCKLGGEPAIALMLRLVRDDQRMDFACLAQAFDLTPAEEGIALHLLSGSSPSDIARSEALSINTVRSHIAHIYAKLEARNREEMWVKCAPFMVSPFKISSDLTNPDDANRPIDTYASANGQ